MTTRLKLAFWCYLLVMAGPAVFGIVFLTRDEFMPYHADAVEMRWADVPRSFQILILALLKLAGGAWLTISAAEFVLLLGPFRRGVGWALWAVPGLGLLHYAGVAIAMTHVTLNTPASPPWGATIASVLVILVAAPMSLTGRPKPAPVQLCRLAPCHPTVMLGGPPALSAWRPEKCHHIRTITLPLRRRRSSTRSVA